MRAARTLSEEDEFGMDKAESFETDPMEVEHDTEVKDHPDFAFVAKSDLASLVSGPEDNLQSPLWLKALPIEKDATQWTFLQVLMRPDRSWLVMKELVATICIGHGMMLAEETASSVLFRKKVGQDTMAHGMMDAATYQNVFFQIGVLPSKLRVLHIGYIVNNEQKLLGGVYMTHLQGISEDRMKVLNRSLDKLLAALQSTITSQFLSASYLYMTTPENMLAPGEESDAIQLDEGYVSDVKKLSQREMKANMRELCIPLEEYAHNEEYSCALLLGLLDPLLKKYKLDVSGSKDSAEAVPHEVHEAMNALAVSDVTITVPGNDAESKPDVATPKDDTASGGKVYGELITDLVHELWSKLKQDCERKVQLKIDEKRKQVAMRVQATQKLRIRALQAIINHPEAEVSKLMTSTVGDRNDVLLYEGSCVVNNIPCKLNVTYGFIIYRTMVPLFARTTIIPFTDVERVLQSTTLGIRVINIELGDQQMKGVTIATGLEIDLLYQLLLEIFAMHKQERAALVVAESPDQVPVEHRDMSQYDAPDLETLMAAEDEEEKENEANEASGTKGVEGTKVQL
ncbi:hypothetical protein Poli38472_000719 [Pythium oligandrum]|uniref:Uncharacterized protein n=1 Tax=Pythium oligandrum TaxID=41045 RepID=A0A8K1FID8_PYTOL|nr:hypothetical protein Poli38472_000719 [Pythium oligandrum]|eukprot:TMW60677.1 hypothetical protein Poli38472_000719 [Pythium oligandrum]